MTAPFTIPIPTYQCHKRVQALKIKAMVPNPRGYELHFEDERFCPIEVSESWMMAKGAGSGGYVVWYGPDNYMSWSPAAAFEAGYTLVEELVFTCGSGSSSDPNNRITMGELSRMSKSAEPSLAWARAWSAFQYEWPGGPSEVEAALASRDAEIERLTAKLAELSNAFHPKTAPEAWLQEQCAGAVGPATQAAREVVLSMGDDKFAHDDKFDRAQATINQKISAEFGGRDAPELTGWQRDLVGLRYASHIRQLIESLFEPWMSDADKDEMVRTVLEKVGTSLKGFDDDIQAGVEKGYPADLQIEIACGLLQAAREAGK